MKRLSVFILLLALSTLSVLAQPDEVPLRVVDVQNLSDLTSANVRSMVVSPDGSMLAWLEPGDQTICLYTFADETPECTPMPEEFRPSNALYWSPDGRYIAMLEDFFIRLFESDIWLFDVENRTLINRTDDGLFGGLFDMENPPIDLVPTWNPANGDLYFFRTQEEGDLRLMDLYRIPAENLTASGLFNGPQFVRRFSEYTPISIFETNNNSLSGATAISPDGSTMAILVRPNDPDFPQSVDLLNLETGELRTLVVRERLNGIGLPNWMDENPGPLQLQALTWTADGTSLLVTTVNEVDLSGIGAVAYYIDIESRGITALTDFSAVAQASDLFVANEATGFNPVYDFPFSSVYLAEENLFVYLNNFQGEGGVSAFELPPENNPQPLRLDAFETRVFGMFTSSVGDDGNTVRILMVNHLITLERTP
ncbi:MAG: hypothetical protein OHK0046_24100 [Anaerolineae bacterium]